MAQLMTLDDIVGLVESSLQVDFRDLQFASLLKNRRILLNYGIDDSLVDYCILPLLQLEEDGTRKPIELIINTPGGSLQDGMVLCNIIDNLKTPTTITVLGQAASMGTYILAAGFNNPHIVKRCYPFSVGLLHGGMMALEGTPYQCKDAADFQTNYEARIREYICSHTLITFEEYDRKKKDEWFMDSKQLKEYGFVNYIIGEDVVSDAVL